MAFHDSILQHTIVTFASQKFKGESLLSAIYASVRAGDGSGVWQEMEVVREEMGQR